MDYEDAARKLIIFSRSLAKGSLSSARGLSVGEAPVLQYLSGHVGEDKTPSGLAERLGYSRPRMTRILDALVAKGFVERRNDPSDRRRVLVRITDAGIAHARQQNAQGVDAVARELQALGDRNAAELLSVLEKAYSITYDKDHYLKQDRK